MKIKAIEKCIRKVILAALLLYSTAPAIAQSKRHPVINPHADFYQLLKEANLNFTFPAGFKAIKAVNNEDFSFDFAMELPEQDFEMWLQVKSQRQNWISYLHTKYDKKTELANPDSMYLDMGKATARALTGDIDVQARNLPPDVLARYNADAGKSYLVNLLDLPVTKHYKYALIISLQKNHTGTLVAVYFTNDKDPDFYKYVYRAGRSFRFKAAIAV